MDKLIVTMAIAYVGYEVWRGIRNHEFRLQRLEKATGLKPYCPVHAPDTAEESK